MYETYLCMLIIASMLHAFDELHVFASSSVKEFILDVGSIGLVQILVIATRCRTDSYLISVFNNLRLSLG